MKRQRVPYARRSLNTVVAVLAIVLVIGLAIAGYEINHQRTEINHLQSQITKANQALSQELQALIKLEHVK